MNISMKFNFNFRTIESMDDLRRGIDFLSKQDLSYPNYNLWVEKAEAELVSGVKTGILAFSEGIVVGDLIYQAHKEFPRVRELKNLRVHPNLRDRYFANFMLKQAEMDLGVDFDSLMIDARENNFQMINFLESAGYNKFEFVNLYENNLRDVVLTKSIK